MQEIIIIIIAIVVLAVVGWKIYRFFTKPVNAGCDYCSDCPAAAGCKNKK